MSVWGRARELVGKTQKFQTNLYGGGKKKKPVDSK